MKSQRSTKHRWFQFMQKDLPCCRERANRSSFFSKSKYIGLSINLAKYSHREQPCSIVGGQHVPYERLEIDSERRYRKERGKHLSIVHENDVLCEECVSHKYSTDSLTIYITNGESKKREIPIEKQVINTPWTARRRDLPNQKRKSLPLQLNRMSRSSKNSFANFPRRATTDTARV